jgi:hypothetical protein
VKRPRTRVSDHAVLRYLERVLGMDVERHRRQIGRLAEAGIDHGATGVVVGKHVLKLKDGVVTTVAWARRPDPRTGRQRGDRPGTGGAEG